MALADEQSGLPTAPALFRSCSSPASSLPATACSRLSSQTRPLLFVSDDDDDGERRSHPRTDGAIITSVAASSARHRDVQRRRQLRVSGPASSSPLLAHATAQRFHPYSRQQHAQQQHLLPAPQFSSPQHSLLSHCALPLPLSASFIAKAQPHESPPAALSSPPSTASSSHRPSHPAPSLPPAVTYHSARLPVVSCRESVSCVSGALVAELLADETAACVRFGFTRVRLIDCRFRYEYDGGHIRRAEWLADHTDLDALLASAMQQQPQRSSAGPLLECVILHCEFSRHRAPSVYRALRRRDRELNGIERFPALHLPELYVMQAGYAAFHSQHPQLCEPHSGAYVSMLDSRHQAQLKRDWKLRKCGGLSASPSASRQLDSAPQLARARSALDLATAVLQHHHELLHDDHSPPLPPLHLTVSSPQPAPLRHLSRPTSAAVRVSRRRPPSGEAHLLRSASFAALRQPLSFHSSGHTDRWSHMDDRHRLLISDTPSSHSQQQQQQCTPQPQPSLPPVAGEMLVN